MPKGYFLSAHRSPADPLKRQAYLQLAGPALSKAGGKTLASTNNVEAHENGVSEQTVLVEFESLEIAIAAFNSPYYQAALKAWDGGADRDIRIFEGKWFNFYSFYSIINPFYFLGIFSSANYRNN